MTQLGGWFGLASDQFPTDRMSKHQLRGVQKLSLEAEPPPALAAAVLRVANDRMFDRRQVCADLVRSPCFEAHAQQRGARKALEDLEMGDRAARPVSAGGHNRPLAAIAPYRRVDGAALGVRMPLHERGVLACDLAR